MAPLDSKPSIFDLQSTVALIPGNVYTLFVSATAGTFGQEFSTNNPYAGGIAFDQAGNGFATVDLVFREGLSTVPEPTSIGLMATVLLGAALKRRALWKRSHSQP